MCVCGNKEARDNLSAQTVYLLNIKSEKTEEENIMCL